MTCIIGCIDKKDNSVWIGADSLGSNGYIKSVESQPKVFRNDIFDNVIMGSTSTFRHIDLLKYSSTLFEEIDKYKEVDIDHKYMVTKFIPKVIELFRDGYISDKTEEKNANFIVGVEDKLFEIQEDYSVLEPLDNFCAVGCGEDVAIGSMYTTRNMDMSVPDRIIEALKAAENRLCGVQRPFVLMNTKDIIVKIIR